jgi:hypothetical protein
VEPPEAPLERVRVIVAVGIIIAGFAFPFFEKAGWASPPEYLTPLMFLAGGYLLGPAITGRAKREREENGA